MVANFWSGVFLRAVVAAGFAGGFGCAILGADLLPRALPQGQLPNDVRLGPLKDLDGYFPFTPCRSVDEWNRRAERVRRQMLVALGLWPFPTRTPLNAVIHGKIERDDYSVEKVYFESLPGFYVTGNLYRPKGSPNGKRKPGILSPHGHWSDGRFHDAGIEVVRREIVEGAERFEEGGRSPLQARCVQLARMGCVVFHYDMIGYADSVQIPQSLAHGFSKQRPEMNTEENWGLFSPAAEAHCQSVMGLQTWNSIRALDFLLSLPDVDPERIGVTGASGGGTQTFILCAVDPRPTLAFPAVMVSTAMQGGCTCENACLLRIGTGNVEFAALFAPKPLGLTSANDWTREMSTKGFPELKQHYAMLGHPENVMLKRGEHFGHNYNYVSRAAMYAWVNRHFKLGLPEPIIESDYRRLTREEMSVWNGEHHKPEGGPEFERRLLKYLTEDAKKLLQQATSDPQTFRRIWGGGIDIVFGRNFGDVGDVRAISKTSRNLEGVPCEILLLRNETHGEELPVICLKPGSDPRSFVVWADVNGKAGLFDGSPASEPRLRTEIKEILDAGVGVVGVDLLFQGEFLADGKQLTKARKVNNPREAAAYTFGYNHALFAQRVHDLLTVVKHLKTQGVETVGLAGFEGAGPWVAGAVAQGMGAVTCAALDTQGFRCGKVLDIYHVDFLPGGAKYGDLAGMLALAPPTRLWVTGETENSLSIARQQFAAAGLPGGLVCWQGAQQQAARTGVRWLVDHLRR